MKHINYYTINKKICFNFYDIKQLKLYKYISMKNLDLNIQNYTFDDILNLFHLSMPILYEDLKIARKVVLKTHPDKSNLDVGVYHFFVKALEILVYVYNFNNNSQQMRESMDEDIDENVMKFSMMSKTDKETFNKKFNELFKETYVKTEEEEHGYEQMIVEYRNKDSNTALIKQDNPTEVNRTFNNITGQKPQDYNSDLNGGDLQYGDVCGVQELQSDQLNEYAHERVTLYKNIHDLKQQRSKQNITPVQNGGEILNQQSMDDDKLSVNRAFTIARQNEVKKERQKQALKQIKQITFH
tara:strand:- start:336 stop:1229 length:894 start_codon:yes stop_codon:yes gene_type:complete